MKKHWAKIYSFLLFTVSFLFIISRFNSMKLMGLFKLVEGNVFQIIASFIIVGYLLTKTYIELSSRNQNHKNLLQLFILFILSTFIAIEIIFIPTSFTLSIVRVELIFRYVAIVGMIYILEYYVIESFDLRRRAIFSSILGFLCILTLIFTLDLLPVVSSLFYFFSMLYCLFIFVSWVPNYKKNGERAKWITMVLISLALANDLIFITLGQKTIELSFAAASVGIIIVYCSKLFQRYHYYKGKQSEINGLNFEIRRLESDHLEMEKQASIMKQEIANRFDSKQRYFENLELIVDVLNTNVIVINDEFKIELAYGTVFNYEDMVGLEISKALFEVLNEDAQYFESVVKKVFDATDKVRENLFLSLLDQKLSINSISYDMSYFVMRKNHDEKVLIMHAEVATNDTLMNNGNQEAEVTSMVTSIVKNSEMFFSDLSTYNEFSKQIASYLKAEDAVEDNIFRVLRRVHTFKGVFDQYNMYATVRGINEVENELFNMLHNTEELSNDQLLKLLIGYDLKSVLRTDIMILKHKLGERFFEFKKKISVDITSFDRVYLSLVQTLGKDHKLLKEVEALKQVDICEVLESYEEYVLRMAKDQGKLIRFEVTGERVKVNRFQLINFFESLIHILKNSVTHGVEYPDERRNAGKDETATLICHVKVIKEMINLTISDDGRGIDVKEIKNRLFILGKYSIDEIDELSDEVVCNMVIEDGVTSYALPNAIAGRGVGMGSVKETVQEIGGEISVNSVRGTGVVYNILLPLAMEFTVEFMKSAEIQGNICLQTERLLTKSEKKSTLSSTWHNEESKVNSDILLDITSYITIKGPIDRRIAITADEKFIYQLLNTYGLQVKYNGSNMKVMNEVMSMFIEDVVCKTVEELKGDRQNIYIEPSCIMSNHMFEELCDGHDGLIAHLEISEGKLSILVIEGQMG